MNAKNDSERMAQALIACAAIDFDGHFAKAAALLRSQAAEIGALREQIANLKTVMIAAAEEIHAHWDAHCDAEGYGPQNLMRRLEEGIPSEYGYTAGAFEALRADAERYRWLRARIPGSSYRIMGVIYSEGGAGVDAAIDAARQS